MRQRAVLVVTWLVATAVATTVGIVATQMVGDVIRGSGPLGRAYDTDAAAVTPTPESRPPIRKKLTFAAVELVVECRGRVAQLVRTEPAEGWSLDLEESGPDEDVDVVLSRGGASSIVEVYCNNGVPRAVLDKPAPSPQTSSPS